MTFEVCAREWLERQNFIKSTRKWAHQGLEIYAYPVIGDKELKEITEVDIDQIFMQEPEYRQVSLSFPASPQGSGSRHFPYFLHFYRFNTLPC